MFNAFGKFWSALFVMFDTVERASNAVNELAQIAEEEARGVKESMAVERAQRIAAMTKSKK